MIRPLYDRVLVRRNKEEEKIGMFYIPDAGKEKPAQGVIIAAGRGRKPDTGGYIDLDVKVGDVILFGKYAGNEVDVDGEKLLMLPESEILGVVE